MLHVSCCTFVLLLNTRELEEMQNEEKKCRIGQAIASSVGQDQMHKASRGVPRKSSGKDNRPKSAEISHESCCCEQRIRARLRGRTQGDIENKAFGKRRFSQKTAGTRRKPQKTAGTRRKPQIGICALRFIPLSAAIGEIF